MERATSEFSVRAGITALLMTSVAAVNLRHVRAGDVASVAFVVVGYGALLLLLRFLRDYELAPPEAAVRRKRLRRRVWCLCTLLTAMFAWKVASVVPWPFTVAVWAVAADAAVAGFFALFLQRA